MRLNHLKSVLADKAITAAQCIAILMHPTPMEIVNYLQFINLSRHFWEVLGVEIPTVSRAFVL
jgi:BarA-like signal transduction histidine kinase